MKTRRWLVGLLTFVLVVVGGCGLWVRQAKQQYNRNRQLIAALEHNDNKQALALVNAGADPNTRQEATPAPTLSQLCRQLLRLSPPAVNNSPTALHLACGDVPSAWIREHGTAPPPPEDAPLVQAMLTHGADVRATDEGNCTPLLVAISWQYPHTAQLLLEHGANVNVPDKGGMMPLMAAVMRKDVDTTRLLLEHGASVTLKDSTGSTALHYAIIVEGDSRIVRLLLEHGADPNARDKDGDTPLLLAQLLPRSDLVRLMQARR